MSESANWEDDVIAALAGLTLEQVPSLEILLLDDVAAFVLSDANPEGDYDEEHGGAIISALLNSLAASQEFRPDRAPESTKDIQFTRDRIVQGAHELATHERGIALLVTRLMPAALGELTNNVGKPGQQIYWSYFYALFVLASGAAGEQDPEVARGIGASFDAWDALLADGFRLPWRVPDE